jgi:hypothetical protein
MKCIRSRVVKRRSIGEVWNRIFAIVHPPPPVSVRSPPPGSLSADFRELSINFIANSTGSLFPKAVRREQSRLQKTLRLVQSFLHLTFSRHHIRLSITFRRKSRDIAYTRRICGFLRPRPLSRACPNIFHLRYFSCFNGVRSRGRPPPTRPRVTFPCPVTASPTRLERHPLHQNGYPPEQVHNSLHWDCLSPEDRLDLLAKAFQSATSMRFRQLSTKHRHHPRVTTIIYRQSP